MSHHLHRIYARHAPTVWELEGRWLRERGEARPVAAVQWIATRSCDLTCGHCYSHAGHRHPNELTTAEALALVDELVAMGCPDFVIAGGEPLVRRDLPEIVAHAVESGLRWSIHTHGGLVERNLELFENYPPALAAVSVDGPRELHDAARGKIGSHAAALRAVELLGEIARGQGDAQVVIGTTVTSRNADHLPDMVEDVLASEADGWGLHLFAPEGRGAEHTELLPSPGQLRRVARLARRWRQWLDVELDNEWGSAGDQDPFYRDQPFLCGAGRVSCVVAVDGSIVPCTTTDPEESEGNVRIDRLRDVWTHGFARFRGGDDRVCSDGSDCWLQARNGHSCRSHAFGDLAPALPVPELPAPPSSQRLAPAALRAMAIAAVSAALAVPVHANDGELPEGFDLNVWVQHGISPDLVVLEHASFLQRGSSWSAWKDAMLVGSLDPSGAAPDPLDPLAKVKAVLGRTGVQPAATLLAALDQAERANVWDPWLLRQLWTRSGAGTAEELGTLYARLETHARLFDALTLGIAEVKAVRFETWRSKAQIAPRQGALVDSPELLAAAKKHFARIDSGTWRSEAMITLHLPEGSTLVRDGRKLAVSGELEFGRFDVLELPKGGEFELGSIRYPLRPSQGAVTSRGLPVGRSFRDPSIPNRMIDLALGGDEAAARAIEQALPAVQVNLRRRLAADPEAPGAPLMRTWLALFDQ